MTLDNHPRPWRVEGLGDTTVLLDASDQTILELPWDDLEAGNGGINDAMEILANAVNALAIQ